MELPIAQELRERYRRLSADELLAIRVSGGLTERARELIEEELRKRGVTEEDIRTFTVERLALGVTGLPQEPIDADLWQRVLAASHPASADQKRRTVKFEANALFVVLARGVVGLLMGAGIGFLLALFFLLRHFHWEWPPEHVRTVLWAVPTAIGALVGLLNGMLVGAFFGDSGRKRDKEVSEPERHNEVEPLPIHEVRDGYQVDDRIFRDRKDAEDYQRFVQAYREDWNKGIESFSDRHWISWLARKQKQKSEDKS